MPDWPGEMPPAAGYREYPPPRDLRDRVACTWVRLIAEAKAAGARILIRNFADPDGHLWEIAWNPGWTITPQGDVLLKKPG